MDIETSASVEGVSRFDRWLATLIGFAAITGALLASLSMYASKQQERSLLLSSRHSVQIFEGIAVTGPFTSFEGTTTQGALELGLRGTARRFTSASHPAAVPIASALGKADVRTSDRLLGLIKTMARVPDATSGIDPVTRRVLGSTIEDLNAQVREQNRQVDLAGTFSSQGSRAAFALSILAVAAVLLGLTGVLGRGSEGRIALVAATGALGVSIAWGASALFL